MDIMVDATAFVPPSAASGELDVICEPIDVELVEELPSEALALLAPSARAKPTPGCDNPAAVRQVLATLRALPVGYVSPLLLEQDLEGFDAPDTYSCGLPAPPSPSQHGAPGSPEPAYAFSSASWIKLGLHVSSEQLEGSSLCEQQGAENGEPPRKISSHSQHRARSSSKPRGTDEMDDLLAALAKALPAGGQPQKQPLQPQGWGSHAAAAHLVKAQHMPLCGLGLLRRRAAAT